MGLKPEYLAMWGVEFNDKETGLPVIYDDFDVATKELSVKNETGDEVKIPLADVDVVGLDHYLGIVGP